MVLFGVLVLVSCVSARNPASELPHLDHLAKLSVGTHFYVEAAIWETGFETSELSVPYVRQPRQVQELLDLHFSEKAVYCALLKPSQRRKVSRATRSGARYFLFSGVVVFDGLDSIGDCPSGGVTIVEIQTLKPVKEVDRSDARSGS
jgi:hypothetical protein